MTAAIRWEKIETRESEARVKAKAEQRMARTVEVESKERNDEALGVCLLSCSGQDFAVRLTNFLLQC